MSRSESKSSILQKKINNYRTSSVVDRNRFEADPDPDFHIDADPDQDPDRYKKTNADPLEKS